MLKKKQYKKETCISLSTCADPESFVRGGPKLESEYDQEIPQSQTADNPMAPWGRATQL